MRKISIFEKLGAVSVVNLLPLVAFAQASVPPSGKNLTWLIGLITYYLNLALGLMMGVALVMFVFYVIKYFIMPNEDRKEAGSYVMYSLIGFFVILSFWGLVNIVQNTFGLQNERNSNWSQIYSIFPNK